VAWTCPHAARARVRRDDCQMRILALGLREGTVALHERCADVLLARGQVGDGHGGTFAWRRVQAVVYQLLVRVGVTYKPQRAPALQLPMAKYLHNFVPYDCCGRTRTRRPWGVQIVSDWRMWPGGRGEWASSSPRVAGEAAGEAGGFMVDDLECEGQAGLGSTLGPPFPHTD
jgi:hypothetical protein